MHVWGKITQTGKAIRTEVPFAVVSLNSALKTGTTSRQSMAHTAPPAQRTSADGRGTRGHIETRPRGTAVLWLLTYKHYWRTTAVPYGVQSQIPVIFKLMYM